ncbi:breast cancer type 2 susceptibility protein [Osmerus eperlanus]|uniref:breast cancer type 2 susceptibility protein n=1 Tax=Osmerus eperlanus TaxID=29151 RepID=UPI002E12B2D7
MWDDISFKEIKIGKLLCITYIFLLFRFSRSRNSPGKTQEQESFELLSTPKPSVRNYVRHITESLGAQMDSNVSWTSSLNTPPTLSPTIILSKNKDSAVPVSLSADREIIFVRKLFPSLSNTAGPELPSENTATSVQPSNLSPEGRIWRQTLPDAIKDGVVRSTVASVLDGSEDVLSVFFSNSSSALRRVKVKERIKRKQSSSTKGQDPLTVGTDQSSEMAEDEHSKDITVSSRITTKTGDMGITQWTPISLSDISDCDLDTLSHDVTQTGQVEPSPVPAKPQTGGAVSCQPVGSQLIESGVKGSLDCSFTRKTRKFVYCIQNPQPPAQGNYSQKTDASNGNVLRGDRGHILNMRGQRTEELNKNPPDENRQQEQGCVTVPPAPAKDQHLEMSQLCRVFAQDFSQMVDSSKADNNKMDPLQHGFSASACLSAVRRRKRQQSSKRESSGTNESVQHQRGDYQNDDRLICVSPSSNLTNLTVQDSGYASTSITQINRSSNQPPCSGFKTGNNKTISVTPQALQKAKSVFEDLKESLSLNITDASTSVSQVNQDMYPCNESSLCTEVSFVKPLNSVKKSQNTVCGTQSPLTASQHADVTELCSLLEDADSQFEFTQFRSAKSSSRVPESVAPHQLSEKELDPEFLTGIDFDDSFNSEKQFVKMANPSNISENKVQMHTSSFDMDKSDVKSSPKVAVGFITAEENHVRVSVQCLSKARALFADLDESCEATRDACFDSSVIASAKLIEPLPLKQQLDEASNVEHLEPVDGDTADSIDLMCIEEDILSNSTDNHKTIAGCSSLTAVHLSDKVDVPDESVEPGKTPPYVLHSHKSHSGFQMSSGKGVTVSAKAIQEACVIFKDYEVLESVACVSPARFKPCEEVPATCSGRFERKNCGFNAAGATRAHVSGKPLLKPEALFSGSGTLGMNSAVKTLKDHQWDSDGGFKKPCTKPATVSAETLLSERALAHNVNSLQRGCGFSTASGKRVAVSDGALQKAKALLSEFNEDGTEKKEARISHTSPTKTLTENLGGFKTASGKGVALSAKALEHTKDFFKDFDANTDASKLADTNEKSVEKRNTHMNAGKSNCGFTTAGGKKVHVSEKSLLRTKALLMESPRKDCGDINLTKPACRERASGSAGDHTHPSPSDNDADANQLPNTVSDSLDELGKGFSFSTASGTTICVSDTSLLKAKSLLNECERDVATSDRLDSANTLSLKLPQKPLCNTANGKAVPVSEKALQEVKSVSWETSHIKYDTIAQSPAECSFGFSTASGKGVHVSEKALKAAFDKFRETENNIVQCEPISEKSDYKTLLPAHDQLEPVTARKPENRDTVLTRDGREHGEGSSLLNLESLGFSGCTDTQQEYFAQEAMDSTKALLEDEHLSGQSSRSFAFHKNPLEKNPACSEQAEYRSRATGKRTGEDADVKEQPPLKRRLLAEFDRTLDCNKRSITPVKSCSDGMLKDRRVFKYNVSLQPNITRPFRDPKSHVGLTLNKAESQNRRPEPTPADIKPSTARGAVFVPPFRKNIKTETHRSNFQQDKGGTPVVLVPQFGKPTSRKTDKDPQPPNNNTTHHLFKILAKTSEPSPALETKDNQSPEMETNYSDKVNKMKIDPQSHEKINQPSGDDEQDVSYTARQDTITEGSTSDQASPGSHEVDLQSLQLALDMQIMRLRKKKRQNIRPVPGSLFLAKTSGVPRVALREAVRGRCPVQHTQKQLYGYGVHQQVRQISSENAEPFCFHCQHFFKREALAAGVQLADGGWLIPRKDGRAGKVEFYRALCDSPGVDPQLISEAWVYNHYRWIVWKQAAMERCFPEVMGGLCLTPEQVLLQLKYRYDVEVDHSRRPALRKIMERDDTVAKTLVLCVCGVVSRGQNRPSRAEASSPQVAGSKADPRFGVIWLTDGWYAIKAQMDAPLTAMLAKGRLVVGGKLVIQGAQLVGPQTACSPLEAPESLMLKIWANGTRPARWDAKLGFLCDPRPLLFPLSSLYGDGGPVGCVDLVVLRSYPVQWMERKPDGGFVFRTGRAEEKEARRHSDGKHKAMEVLFAKVQAQFEKEDNGKKTRGRRGSLRRQDIEDLQDGEELHEAVQNDPAYLEASLSEQQRKVLTSYRSSLGERRQAQLQESFRRALEADGGHGPNREVTPVWKLCVADSRDQRGTSVCMLSIWRPSMDLQSFLREGCRYRAHHLSTSEGRKRSGGGSVQLTTTKRTQFQGMQASQDWLAGNYHARVAVSFHDLRNPEFQPFCGEVDIVGYVISITSSQGFSQVVYMVDGKLDFVKVHSYSSLVQLGLEDLVKPRALLAVSNLQLRTLSSPIPGLHASDLALFTSNPKDSHLQEAFTQLRALVQGQELFFLSAEERLSNLIPSDPSSFSSPALQPRTPAWKTQDGGIHKTPQQPIRGFGSMTPINSSLPPPISSSGKLDPKSLKRKRGLDSLCRIPSPPPIYPLGTMTTPCVNKTFNPPRRSDTPAQTPAPRPAPPEVEDEWVNDEELAMIDTQALYSGLGEEVTR